MKNLNSDIIAEGIDKSFIGVWLEVLAFVVIFIGILFIILVGYSLIQDKIYKHNHPELENMSITTQGPSCFPYNSVECKVLIGNDSMTFLSIQLRRTCGYDEANIQYELTKPWLEQQIKEDNEMYHRNLKVRWLECN